MTKNEILITKLQFSVLFEFLDYMFFESLCYLLNTCCLTLDLDFNFFGKSNSFHVYKREL